MIIFTVWCSHYYRAVINEHKHEKSVIANPTFQVYYNLKQIDATGGIHGIIEQ